MERFLLHGVEQRVVVELDHLRLARTVHDAGDLAGLAQAAARSGPLHLALKCDEFHSSLQSISVRDQTQHGPPASGPAVGSLSAARCGGSEVVVLLREQRRDRFAVGNAADRLGKQEGHRQLADLGDLPGRIGDDLSAKNGQQAARICALNLLAQVKAALDGDLDRVNRVVRLGGFVNSAADFTGQPMVINAAPDLMVEVFGDKGRHARSAVGFVSLPFHIPVEIEMIVQVSN